MKVVINIRICLIAAACVGLFVVIHPATADTISVEFSNFTIGDTFPNATLPRTIVADGVDVELTKYNNSAGANGRIVNRLTTGTNNALFLAANLRAEIVLPDVSPGGFFYFRNQGGDNLLEINGQTLDFTNSALAGPDFATLGGVEIHSSGLGNFWRSVKLDGLISTLAFIGQELSIDRVQLGIGLPGDNNLDHSVDAADYVVWRKTNDSQYYYNVWRTYFGASSGTGSASGFAAPEPSATMLTVLALCIFCRRRRARA
jgi:hypothetical protein